ncbi:unnamed protein product, partial [Polarella glacialis]
TDLPALTSVEVDADPNFWEWAREWGSLRLAAAVPDPSDNVPPPPPANPLTKSQQIAVAPPLEDDVLLSMPSKELLAIGNARSEVAEVPALPALM